MRAFLACVVACAALVSPALAATTTVGLRELPTSSSTTDCYSEAGSCPLHIATTTLPAESGLDRVPYDGRIVGWRFRGYGSAGTLQLRVATGEPPTLTSRSVSEPAPPDAWDGRLIPLDTPLQAEAGDLIAVTGNATGDAYSPAMYVIAIPGAAARSGSGAWSDTGTFTLDAPWDGTVPAYNAELEIAAPVITGLTPASGGGGTTVTIAGDHFTGAERVTFGGVEAFFEVQSDTTITAAAPAGPAGSVPVVVEGPGGASAPGAFTYPEPPTPPDTTDPVVQSLLISPTAFRARKGATIVYRLSEAAATVFTVQRARKGRRKGSRCVIGRKRGKRCVKWRAVDGSVAHVGTAGFNELAFTATLDGKRLKRGRYRLTAVATDAAGNASAPVRKRFRVKR